MKTFREFLKEQVILDEKFGKTAARIGVAYLAFAASHGLKPEHKRITKQNIAYHHLKADKKQRSKSYVKAITDGMKKHKAPVGK